MTDEYAPPAVPKSDNSTGDPVPPSGLHPTSSAPTVITNVGADGLPPVPAAVNVHGSPSKPGRSR